MTDDHRPGVTRALIVEDDTVFRVPLRAALVAQGYAVVAVESAEVAEVALAQQVFDVVISDVGLPEMDGAVLAARHPAIPFVLITGRSPVDAADTPLPPSVVACLEKPFDVSHLLSVLEEAVKMGGATARHRSGQRAVNPHV